MFFFFIIIFQRSYNAEKFYENYLNNRKNSIDTLKFLSLLVIIYNNQNDT